MVNKLLNIKKEECQIMEKPESCFKLLYFLSAADGQVDRSEADVIARHLIDNFKEISLKDVEEFIESLSSMNVDRLAQELEEAATTFYENSNSQERLKFLDVALDLIAADGKLSEGESNLFYIIGNKWNINIGDYINKKMFSL